MLQRYTLSIIVCLLFATSANAQATSDYAVQLSASVQASPAKVTLTWRKITGVTTYTIYRKLISTAAWGTGTNITDTTYTDVTVHTDSAYEYKVVQLGGPGAAGYIYAGIQAPPIHTRGSLVLLVDSTFSDSCSALIHQLMQDMSGDGWQVIRHDYARTTRDSIIRNAIIADYFNYFNVVSAVYILGHIAVPYSGDLNPDGHPNHLGAWPADAYYGNMNGTWTDLYTDTSAGYAANRNRPGDGKWDQTAIPTAQKLGVGRVDFANMPSFSKTEVQMMRSYLIKAHQYKMDSLLMVHRALIDDHFGAFGGEAFAANGWRIFPPMVGAGNIQSIPFIASLNDSTYQWAYACGGGSFNSASGVGSTSNFATNHVNAIFTLMFGSYFGDWNSPDNFLRAPLCSDVPALTSCWAGRPNWFMHHMALGWHIGYSAMVTQNNSSYIPTGYGNGWVHVALMGDPTLRTDYIKPVTSVHATATTAPLLGADITWVASPDPAVTGYNIYRSDSMFGNYLLITRAPVTGISFHDSGASLPVNGLKYYMVRPIKLQQTPSGSYYNLGIGVTDSATVRYQRLAVSNTPSATFFTLYPNPATTYLNIRLTINTGATASITIIGNDGRQVLSAAHKVSAGSTVIPIDVHNLVSGIYTISINTGAEKQSLKWIKVD
ncbi:MAG: T9SS type A sorting domain-containing protein [Taibaiella sp.]|nr:T9SS type A sorting domain-containing protein [Taibaiella sp.]